MLAHGTHHARWRFPKPLALGILSDEAQDAANMRFGSRDLGGLARNLVFNSRRRKGTRFLLRWHRPRSMPSDGIALNANRAQTPPDRKIVSQAMQDSVFARGRESP